MKNLVFTIIFYFGAIGQTFGATQLENEIHHLLDYLSESDCEFIRNGNRYGGEEAVKHIQKKYDHFKDDIKSAEDFIRLSASKSLISKKSYSVACPGEKEIKSADWLLQELNNFRSTN